MSKNSQPKSAPGDSDCDCGYEASNRRHKESYWEDRTDPREKLDDKHMRFNSHYYKVIDRQIAENHHSECLGNGGGTWASEGPSANSSKK